MTIQKILKKTIAYIIALALMLSALFGSIWLLVKAFMLLVNLV